VHWEQVSLAAQAGLLGPTGDRRTRGSPEPSAQGGSIRSHGTRHAPEPSQWVRCLRTRGNTGAHLGWEAGSGDAGHVAASDPTSAGRLDPMSWDTWQRVGARLVLCLDLRLVRRGTRSAGYRQH
jgi:hypothetical protein